MGKMIISSKSFHIFLRSIILAIQKHEVCQIIVKEKKLYIDGIIGDIDCHSDKNSFEAKIKTQSILNLWEILSLVEDQPITLEFTGNNWVTIKEIIL